MQHYSESAPKYGDEGKVRLTCESSYICSIIGILNLLEMIFSIVVAACAAEHLCFHINGDVGCFAYHRMPKTVLFGSAVPPASGQGFVICMAAIVAILSGIFFFIMVFNIHELFKHKLPFSWRAVEIDFPGFGAVLYLLIAAVETWYAGGYNLNKAQHAAAIMTSWQASAAFAWFTLIIFIVHFALMYFDKNIVFRKGHKQVVQPASDEPHPSSYGTQQQYYT